MKEQFIASNMQTFNNYNTNEYSNIELDFKNIMEDSYIIVGIKHGDETPTNSVVVALNTIALS